MMNQRNTLITVILLTLLIFTLWQPSRFFSEIKPESDTSFSDTLSTSDDGFDRVMGPQPFSFPEDFGADNQHQTKWWYFTGNLHTGEQRKFAYEIII